MSDNYSLIITPTGTRDLNPNEVHLRETILFKIKKYFELYGGQPIDTPVFEYMQTVKNLYGEEFNKLVFTLDDQENEISSNKKENTKLLLRYDLTLPFC